MKRIIAHIRNNMTAADFQQYCEDFITGCVLLVVLAMIYGLT